MSKKTEKIFLIVLLLALLVGLLYGANALASPALPDEIKSNPKRTVSCDITVVDGVTDAPEIRKPVQCNLLENCGTVFGIVDTTLNVLYPQRVIFNKGKVTMHTGSERASKKIRTFALGDTETVTLDVCTRWRSGSIVYTNDDGDSSRATFEV